MDWQSIFLPDIPLLEIVLRGSLMYIALFVLLRVILKRQTGSVGMTDLLLIVLIADASQNAMAGEYRSLPAGIVLVSTIIFWSYALDWLSFQSKWSTRLAEPPPLPLTEDGQLLYRNMRKELITEDELMSQLRVHGLDNFSKVKKAHMESDGRISIVPYDEKPRTSEERRKPG